MTEESGTPEAPSGEPKGGRSPDAAGGWMAAWPRRATPAAPPPARSAGPPSTCETSSPVPASPCRPPLPPSLLSLRTAFCLSLSCWGRTGCCAPWPWFLSLARWGPAAVVSLSKKARGGEAGSGVWSRMEGRCGVAVWCLRAPTLFRRAHCARTGTPPPTLRSQ